MLVIDMAHYAPLLLACLCVTVLNLLAPTSAVGSAAGRCENGGHKRTGCRIQTGMCLCGHGCSNDYQYTSEEECNRALKGQHVNICLPNPCQHGGACSQTTMVHRPHGYRCRCEGTGFYGPRCENRCPTPGEQLPAGRPFPYECIVI